MRLLLCALLPLILGSSSAVASPYNPLKEVAKGVEKSLDVAKNVANFTPGIDEIAQAGKDLVFGAPIQVILEGINKVCSLALATEGDVERSKEVIPEFQDVKLTFIDMKYNNSYNVHNVAEMVKLDTFNKDNPTVIVTTGWLSMRGNKTGSSAETLLRAYNCRGNVNFILFDSGLYIATIYTWSARNTETLGKFLGDFLVELTKHVDVAKLHLVGHSLGAQISGEAGRQFQEKKGDLIPRITALDPARPCFNEGEVLNGVGRGDADFVDVIHTNNGALGQRNPIGDADFYPNGVIILQPGTLNIAKSHNRAVQLYAESVLPGNERTFLATKCNSMYSLNAGLCERKKTPMGYAAVPENKGNYFVKTESKSPYGEAKINSCAATGASLSDDSDSEDGDKPSTTTEASSVSSTTTTAAAQGGESTTTTTSTTAATTTTKKGKLLGVFG